LVSIFLTICSYSASAQQTQTSCSDINLPAGWVVYNDTLQYGACGAPSGVYGHIFILINTSGQSSVTACRENTLPPGWVVGNITLLRGACGIYPTDAYGDVFTLINTVGLSSVTSCRNNTLPPNWVVSYSTNQYGACGVYPTSAIGTYYNLVSNNPSQTITFGVIPSKILGSGSFQVYASASSGLPVSFQVGPLEVCNGSGNTVNLVGVGSCRITASQPGSLGYKAAYAIVQYFDIVSAVSASISQSLTSTIAGSPYMVAWSSANATSCSVDASRNNEVPIVIFNGLNGSQTVSPSVIGTHVWRNICQGPGGPSVDTFTHTVNPPAVVVIYQSLSTTVAGSPYVISWSSTNASSCIVDFSRNGEVPITYSINLSGSATISPVVIGTHIWRNTCQGAGGPVQTSYTHTVTAN